MLCHVFITLRFCQDTISQNRSLIFYKPYEVEAELEDEQNDRESNGLWLQLGANAGQGLNVGINGMSTRHLGYQGDDLINLIDVKQANGEQISSQLSFIDHATSYTNRERAYIGAVINRLEFTMSNLDISSENLSSAKSRIKDTNMALEMMKLTVADILQQAATSILAQANQSPQIVLQLLQ